MHCDMLKIQDGGAIVEKLNWKTKYIAIPLHVLKTFQDGSNRSFISHSDSLLTNMRLDSLSTVYCPLIKHT